MSGFKEPDFLKRQEAAAIAKTVGLFIRRHLQETEAFLEARGAATVK
jgi:hypothetical protein